MSSERVMQLIGGAIAAALVAWQTGTSVKVNDVASTVYPREALDARHQEHDFWRETMERRVEHLETFHPRQTDGERP